MENDIETKEGFFSNLPHKPFFLNFLIWVQIIGFVLGLPKGLSNLFLNFSGWGLLGLVISILLFISALGLMKLKKWGLYSYISLIIISYIISISSFYKMSYVSSLPLSSNYFLILSIIGALIYILVVGIYLFCIRKLFK